MSRAQNRPKPQGRRPGPTSTREDILRAARRRFAGQGYDRATFRNIAADAGVDPALVVQFFGSKQDLFLAASAPPVSLAALSEEAEEPEDLDPSQAGLRLARILLAQLEDEDSRDAMVARIRSAATEPAAAAIVRGMVSGLLAEFAPQLGGDRPEERAAFLASQFLGIVWVRHVVELEPIASMSGEEIAEWIAPTFQRYLLEPLG